MVPGQQKLLLSSSTSSQGVIFLTNKLYLYYVWVNSNKIKLRSSYRNHYTSKQMIFILFGSLKHRSWKMSSTHPLWAIGAIAPPKTYGSNLFHHDFLQFGKTPDCQLRLDCQILLNRPS